MRNDTPAQQDSVNVMHAPGREVRLAAVERPAVGFELAAVLLGGALGTALRLWLDAVFVHEPVTLVVNTAGSFTLGLVVARVWRRAPRWLRAGLGAGLLGSFTTFSAVAASVVQFAATDLWMPAAAYLVSSVALGFAAAALGVLLGGRTAPNLDLVDE